MSLFGRFKQFSRPQFSSPKNSPKPPAAPRLEALEDRSVPSTFTVTNTADSGFGSLRQAILEADLFPGTNTIDFRIGSGHKTITPLSALPTLTKSILLDGTTQPGYAGSPLIELNGSQAGSGVNGLQIEAANCTVRGLVVNRFSQVGIVLGGAAATGDKVVRNYVGTDWTGTVALGNADGGVGIAGASNDVIGGTTAADRNLISGNGGPGVGIGTSNGYPAAASNKVEGNYIGTDVTGTKALANASYGVVVGNASDNVIGGQAPGAGNLISGNTQDGVYIVMNPGQPMADGNQVLGDQIGTDAKGKNALGNGGNGVSVVHATNTLIGGTGAGAADTIASNGGVGVEVDSSTGNAIRGNSIYGNAGLGILLSDNGNNNQPYPVLTSAVLTGNTVSITGTLTSAPGTTYALDFYVNAVPNPSGFGDGRVYLGTAKVKTNALGVATFSATFTATGTVAPGKYVAATATDPLGDTSQFSADLLVTGVSSPNLAGALLGGPGNGPLGQQGVDHVTVNVGQPAVDAVVAHGQAFVVQSQQVQDGGVDVVTVCGSGGVGGLEGPFVAFPDGHAPLDAAAG